MSIEPPTSVANETAITSETTTITDGIPEVVK
jgi:hypothetical protein